MYAKNSLDYAQKMDLQDPLAHLRGRFFIPQINDKDAYYFTGNSLGLQPKSVQFFFIKSWMTGRCME